MSRLRLWGSALVLALAVAGVLLVIVQSPASRASADFTDFYSAGRLVLAGHAAHVYDHAWLDPVLKQTAPGVTQLPGLIAQEPVAIFLPIALLATMPVDVALHLWQIASVALLLTSLLVLQRAVPLRRHAPVVGLVVLIAAIPTWSLLLEGQLSAVLLLGGALLVAGVIGEHPVVVGAGAALLAAKPQYLPVFLVLLVGLRRPRAGLFALVGAAIVLLSPVAAGGPAALAAMVHDVLATNGVTPLRLSETWSGFLASMLPVSLQMPAALVLLAVALGIVAVAAARMRDEPLALIALAAWLAVLASPHALPHDLVLLAVSVWCAMKLSFEGRIPSPWWGLLACDAALMVDALDPPVRVGAVAMTAVLVVYALAFMRRRAARDRRPLPAAA